MIQRCGEPRRGAPPARDGEGRQNPATCDAEPHLAFGDRRAGLRNRLRAPAAPARAAAQISAGSWDHLASPYLRSRRPRSRRRRCRRQPSGAAAAAPAPQRRATPTHRHPRRAGAAGGSGAAGGPVPPAGPVRGRARASTTCRLGRRRLAAPTPEQLCKAAAARRLRVGAGATNFTAPTPTPETTATPGGCPPPPGYYRVEAGNGARRPGGGVDVAYAYNAGGAMLQSGEGLTYQQPPRRRRSLAGAPHRRDTTPRHYHEPRRGDFIAQETPGNVRNDITIERRVIGRLLPRAAATSRRRRSTVRSSSSSTSTRRPARATTTAG